MRSCLMIWILNQARGFYKYKAKILRIRISLDAIRLQCKQILLQTHVYVFTYACFRVCLRVCICEWKMLIMLKSKIKVRPCTGTGSVQAVRSIGEVEV
jgi:hypothetical protein